MQPTNGKLVANDTNSTNYDTGTIGDVCKANNSFRILSTDNTLSALTVDGQGVSGFAPKAENYKHTTSATFVKIGATANDKNATVKINGAALAKENKINLQYGQQMVLIEVTSESGVAKTYNLNIFL